MNSERGSAPIWFLGLSICVLMVGAMSTELWRIIGERQELVAMADAAAIAAANAIDMDAYRETGLPILESRQAEELAIEVIAGSSGASDLASAPVVVVSADGLSVAVELTREVPFGLIRILALADDEFVVTATAIAYPLSP